MNASALSGEFGCEECGSPSILLPSSLKDDALVHCGCCGACLGNWQTFKDRARRIIMTEAGRSRRRRAVSSDPLPAAPS